jgi:hypothetical protein
MNRKIRKLELALVARDLTDRDLWGQRWVHGQGRQQAHRAASVAFAKSEEVVTG